jgi:hypothetical protein
MYKCEKGGENNILEVVNTSEKSLIFRQKWTKKNWKNRYYRYGTKKAN